ncbi:ERF family protein [Nocardia cerradoensis]|uniref:ERF family protein n=1 Tax=Nocardia cerradoensis TaxID=85688 RepID=A0A231GT72_9NOCA|nr:ERF family protein [Nocardia cerradoensis]NKY47970.1 hypothetical protein [Nocardia cerradoensis]OXR39816.1 hypothetical protein B7C42_08104 [Nocardia cerradoensis]
MADAKPTVFEAFSAVQGEIQAIEKNEHNSQQGFNFRGIDAVMNAVGPVLREHGVFIIPRGLSIQFERYETKSKTAMRNATVEMEYTVFGPAGDSFTGSAYGEAADSGDKAVSKAQSVAFRTFLLQGLTIPTRQDDPDASSHDRVTFSQEAQDARDDLTELCAQLGIHPRKAMRDFADANGGLDIRQATDPGPIRGLANRYRAENPAPDFAENQGAAGDEPA